MSTSAYDSTMTNSRDLESRARASGGFVHAHVRRARRRTGGNVGGKRGGDGELESKHTAQCAWASGYAGEI